MGSDDMERCILVLLGGLLCGCENRAPAPAPVPSPNAVHGSVLPFRIVNYSVSNLYQGNIVVAQIDATADGGSSPDWAATAIAIAEHAQAEGADSIKVTLNRSDLEGSQAANALKHLAELYFSPNPQHSVWNDKPWSIDVAPALLPTEVIQRDTDYWALVSKYQDQGMTDDRAERLAGRKIAQTYHQPKDWRLSNGALAGKSQDRADFIVDYSGAADSIKTMDACIAGKMNVVVRDCS